MIMDVEVPQTAKVDEEVTLKLVVKTELRECMVVSSKAEGVNSRNIHLLNHKCN